MSLKFNPVESHDADGTWVYLIFVNLWLSSTVIITRGVIQKQEGHCFIWPVSRRWHFLRTPGLCPPLELCRCFCLPLCPLTQTHRLSKHSSSELQILLMMTQGIMLTSETSTINGRFKNSGFSSLASVTNTLTLSTTWRNQTYSVFDQTNYRYMLRSIHSILKNKHSKITNTFKYTTKQIITLLSSLWHLPSVQPQTLTVGQKLDECFGCYSPQEVFPH